MLHTVDAVMWLHSQSHLQDSSICYNVILVHVINDPTMGIRNGTAHACTHQGGNGMELHVLRSDAIRLIMHAVPFRSPPTAGSGTRL